MTFCKKHVFYSKNFSGYEPNRKNSDFCTDQIYFFSIRFIIFYLVPSLQKENFCRTLLDMLLERKGNIGKAREEYLLHNFNNHLKKIFIYQLVVVFISTVKCPESFYRRSLSSPSGGPRLNLTFAFWRILRKSLYSALVHSEQDFARSSSNAEIFYLTHTKYFTVTEIRKIKLENKM